MYHQKSVWVKQNKLKKHAYVQIITHIVPTYLRKKYGLWWK